MNIQVMSKQEIEDFKTDTTYIVISVRTPGAEIAMLPKSNSRIGTLFLAFPDLDEIILGHEKYGTEDKLFNKEHAESILLFVEGMEPLVGLVVCQCEAGISRSAGVAGALSYIYNNDDTYFFKHYLPNRLVYKTLLETHYYGKNV